MSARKQFFLLAYLMGSTLLYAQGNVSPPAKGTDPLSVNYVLDKIEDDFEKSKDKLFKVNWDFEIIYHDHKVFIIIEYDEKDSKPFNKLSTEQLETLIQHFTKEITSVLHKDIEINGIIRKDDTENPSYRFMYKNGNLNIK